MNGFQITYKMQGFDHSYRFESVVIMVRKYCLEIITTWSYELREWSLYLYWMKSELKQSIPYMQTENIVVHLCSWSTWTRQRNDKACFEKANTFAYDEKLLFNHVRDDMKTKIYGVERKGIIPTINFFATYSKTSTLKAEFPVFHCVYERLCKAWKVVPQVIAIVN